MKGEDFADFLLFMEENADPYWPEPAEYDDDGNPLYSFEQFRMAKFRMFVVWSLILFKAVEGEGIEYDEAKNMLAGELGVKGGDADGG